MDGIDKETLTELALNYGWIPLMLIMIACVWYVSTHPKI